MNATAPVLYPILMLAVSLIALNSLAGAEERPEQQAGEGHSLDVKSTFEVGYRWHQTAGNNGVYRSLVNLGSGMRLLHSSMELSAPENGGIRANLFDKLALNFDGVGIDPDQTR